MRIVPGPDFPTGGLIYGRAGIEAGVPHRPRHHRHARPHERREDARPRRPRADRRHRDPLPGQQGAARTPRSPSCMRDKKLEGISEVRDESDRDGMRLVIELKKDAMPAGGHQPALPADRPADDASASSTSPSHHGRPAVLNLKETLERLRRAPPRRRHPPHALRAAPGRGAARDHRRPGHGRSPTSTCVVEDHPRERATPTSRATALMALPLAGPRGVRAPRRPPAEPRSTRPRTAHAVLPVRAPGQGHPRDAPLAPHRPRAREARQGVRRARPTRSRASAPSSPTRSSSTTSSSWSSRTSAPSTPTSAAPRSSPNEAEITGRGPHPEEDMVVTISHAGYIKRTSPERLPRAEARRQGQASAWRRARKTG